MIASKKNQEESDRIYRIYGMEIMDRSEFDVIKSEGCGDVCIES